MGTEPLGRSEGEAGPAGFERGKPRVLLVDDDPILLNSLRRRLREYFDIRLAKSAREALALMQQNGPFAVIVADMTMPGMDGATLLSEVKRFFPGTVRLMLTGQSNNEVVDRAVNECEVFRFLQKPCNPTTLDRALEEAVDMHEEMLHARLHGSDGDGPPARAQRVRRFDLTTGLASRHSFEAEVLAAFAHAGDAGNAPVLIHFDIDNFRLVNEACGLLAGDTLLRHVAEVISNALGSDVPVARLSGDEFGVLLSSPERAAESVCNAVIGALADSPFYWGDDLWPISACAGAVPLTVGIEGLTSWLLLAETACGVAKQIGAGRLHIASQQDPKLLKRQDERVWLSRTQRALATNGFRLMFQRIAPLQDTAFAGMHFELLLRMTNELGAPVSPSCFMPVAERYHLSAAIDRWVLRNAFEWLAGNRSRLDGISLCSLNISGGTLCDPQFPALLLGLQKHHGLPAAKICLEITETAAVEDLESAARIIRELRDTGFRFALDDFGSGLCSFSYLQHLPVEYLKLDGSFVRQIDSDPISFAMVRSINDIGHVTGKKTVAEFVENEAIARAVRSIGVDFAQGYVIHAPEPLENF